MMAKARLVRLGIAVLGVLVCGCEVDDPCMDNDPELVEKFGVPEHQTEGPDGLCYTVDPQVKNWGAPCDSLALCGGGLICPGNELPICTAVGCNPDPEKDEVCANGFACVQTGEVDVPTICVPLPPAPPPSPPASSEEPNDPADAGSGDAAVESPNIGTECDSAEDPVCVGGTFCEAQSLHYCTVPNCAEGLENEAACAAIGVCFATPPAPASGICTIQ